jgi:PKD repeat protein
MSVFEDVRVWNLIVLTYRRASPAVTRVSGPREEGLPSVVGPGSAIRTGRLSRRSVIVGATLSWLLFATVGSQAPADAASGVSYVGRVASKTSSTSANSASLATTRQVAAGDSLILAILLSSGPATGTVTIADPAGNQYSIDRDQTDGTDGDRLVVASARAVASIASGGIIKVTFPTYAEYHISIDEFAGVVAPDRSASGWAKSSSFNSGSTATTSQATDLLFGVVGNESGAVSTFASGWTALPSLDISTDHLRAGYQVTTAAGSFAATGTTGGTWMAAVVAYTTPTGPPPDAPPNAALTVSPGSGLAPLQVSADASGSTDTDATPIATYAFDWGDGTAVIGPQSGPTAPHTFASPGSYTVTVTVKDTAGLSSTATKPVTVNPDLAPVPALTVTPNPVAVQLPVTADASGSKDTDGTPIATYTFDWGDGTPSTGPQAGSSAPHTYANPGTYSVTVKVTDTANLSSTATKTLTVLADAPPAAALTVTPSTGFAPLGVTADASASTDADATPIATYTFDWGDGTSATGPQPGPTAPHTYAAAGSYTAKVTVTDTGGLSSFTTKTVTVSPDAPPSAALTVTPSSGIAPLKITADASGSTDPDPTPISTYTFDWGDGTAVTGPQSGATAQHTYAAAGSFTVTVTVKDTGGRSATATRAVTVTPDAAPVAKLSVTKSSSDPMQVTADGSASTDTDATPVGSYRFDFGDGTAVVTTNAPTSKATHTYVNAGTFIVKLTAIDTAGNASVQVTTSVSVSNATGSGIAVYAGYYDTHHSGRTQPKPSPWGSSLLTVFVGKPDTSSGGWDASAVRVDNLSGVTMNSVVVTVDIGSSHFSLWGTHTLLPGQSLVLTQTAFENFDGSDKNKAGCYGCDPSLCTTARYTTIPVVHVTVDGKTTVYNDTAQVLNTRGADSAGCPYTGTRNDESTNWRLLG